MGYQIVTINKDFYFCDICGSLVSDTEKHDIFHEGLGKTAQMAYHADMMTRPIRIMEANRETEL